MSKVEVGLKIAVEKGERSLVLGTLIYWHKNDDNIASYVEKIGSLSAELKLHNKRMYNSRNSFSFRINRNYRYLKLGLRALQYCGNVLGVKLLYYSCSSINFNAFDLIDIDDTIEPLSCHLILSRKCFKYAVPRKNILSLTVTCYYNG